MINKKCEHLEVDFEGGQFFGVEPKMRFGICKECKSSVREIAGKIIREDDSFMNFYEDLMEVLKKHADIIHRLKD